MGERINAAEAAQRLGGQAGDAVRLREPGHAGPAARGDGRSSLFEEDEIARLAERGQPDPAPWIAHEPPAALPGT